MADLERRLEELERRLERLEARWGSPEAHEGNGHLDSPAGRADPDAWEAPGGDVHHADRWVEGPPGSPGWGERLERCLGERGCQPDEGLRLRFVMERLPHGAFDLLELAAPALERVRPSGCRYVHLEVMRGPVVGMHVAFDNRMPALLTQDRLEVPAEGALHVNVVLAGSALGEDWPERARQSLGDLPRSRVHQVTVGCSESGPGLGVETIHDEQGTEGGFPAAESRAL